MNSITIEAPAKINLTLDIKGKRDDGYHELETVMHQIDLLDYIKIEKTNENISIQSENTQIPNNEENLAYKAAELFFQKNGIKRKGVNIFIQKNIPVGAGLAGGSTNAAGVLKGLNQLYAVNLDQKSLLKLGEYIGSDVPFCIMGGTALAKGRGEVLTPINTQKLTILLVKPKYQLSTAEIYKNFAIDKVEENPNNGAFLEAWNNNDIINITSNIANVLESVSIAKYPEIANIKNKLKNLGALNAIMSGSGPTVFGIFNDRKRALNAHNYFKEQYQEVFLVSSYIKR
ncbi:4-diphosphocytidyl-2-C-methyl-D-erythritol kinase [Candidatus Syntrophocurvum alkaliphilum]|uniref:4-diphosphocytidyl-2-C-methyl-D-erythritol kinase n=1 Tax=Candidatus Syntrophocurvum alkaliphilum TaxID=2293317 RepID=A0A6I6DD38_9FIRM|nr:4-(cytidine 5'-diphospho)-2-C-methyl-D-erythritol kinase [Candidatus Syntrophocurvum alkaliphilum]QGU00545.1 4-diphosphocytidyl-2-C-methyl-D-erythritol kinase [Candidatus Syntrophocurvum alkaliphilum]